MVEHFNQVVSSSSSLSSSSGGEIETNRATAKIWMDMFWNLPLSGNIVCFLLLYLFDVIIASKYLYKARWYALHAFANILVVITAFPSVIVSIKDPFYCADSRIYNDRSLFGTASPWPTYITNSVHVYHLMFFQLSSQDYFHHLCFIPTVGVCGQYFHWGAVQGYMAFFISGLPGAIDYVLLVLVKYGKVQNITQKNICASLNVNIRGPMILISAYTMYVALLYRQITVPWQVCIFIFTMAVFNSVYYTRASVANAALSHALYLIESAAGKKWSDDFSATLQIMRAAKMSKNTC